MPEPGLARVDAPLPLPWRTDGADRSSAFYQISPALPRAADPLSVWCRPSLMTRCRLWPALVIVARLGPLS